MGRTDINALETLRNFVQTHGTQKQAAALLGIKQQYLSDLLKERRGLSPRVLKALGLERHSIVRRTP